jgi:hypothetical protein
MLYDLYFNHELLFGEEKILPEGLHERHTESLLHCTSKYDYVVLEKLLGIRSYYTYFVSLYELILKRYNSDDIDRVNRTTQQLDTAIERLKDHLTELTVAINIISRCERIDLEYLDLSDEEFMEQIVLRSDFWTFVNSCTSVTHAFIRDIEILRDKVSELLV